MAAAKKLDFFSSYTDYIYNIVCCGGEYAERYNIEIVPSSMINY